ncbi:winged helix-turn-helix domain-containing protein, partial [Vibrio parahaemolyticus]
DVESCTGFGSYQDAVGKVNATHVLPGNVGRLLSVLCTSYPRFVNNREIKQRVWNHEFLSDESVTQLIKRTRSYLGDESKTVIVNTKGRGYRLQIQVLEPPSSQTVAMEVSESIAIVADEKRDYLYLSMIVLLLVNTLYNVASFIGYIP